MVCSPVQQLRCFKRRHLSCRILSCKPGVVAKDARVTHSLISVTLINFSALFFKAPRNTRCLTRLRHLYHPFSCTPLPGMRDDDALLAAYPASSPPSAAVAAAVRCVCATAEDKLNPQTPKDVRRAFSRVHAPEASLEGLGAK